MPEFVHLRVHSDFSLSEGASKIEDIIGAAKEVGFPAMALTDKDNLFGAMDFSKKASSYGIQPIIGCHLHTSIGDGKLASFILLAKNEAGYKNLCAINLVAHDPVPDGKGEAQTPEFPTVPIETLSDYADGLILLTGGGKDGLLPSLAARSPEEAAQAYQWLLSVFGDRLYVEICRNRAPTEAEAAVEDILIDLAYGAAGPVDCADGMPRAAAPLVATTDVWYATPDRHEAWHLLKAVESKTAITMDGDNLVGIDRTLHHLRSAEDMANLFADLPEAVANTVNVAMRCAYMVKGRKPILPPFACGEGRNEADELTHQAVEGLAHRLRTNVFTPEMDDAAREEAAKPYHERLEYELSVIKNMGFPGYFLIVSDFIKWAKANDIPVGPGRGSGAGSIVAWALTITDLDPLRYGLLFERFLNPERVSMPDFDVDFCQDRRGEVIQYVRKKYGNDHVSMIATFGLIKAAGALKDAGRVIIHEQHGTYGFGDINDLTKLIPKKLPDPDGNDHDDEEDTSLLAQTYRGAPEFRDHIDNSEKLRILFEQAKRIEGLARNFSTHAAGVVIGDRPLKEYVPVTWDPKAGMPVCSFNMKGTEGAGLVKFDFLGLTTLSVCHKTLGFISKFKGKTIDLALIPRDDQDVYRLFAEGKTTGIFQFEGGGMRRVLRQVKPTRLEDLIAVNALYRPGPMDYIPLYAARKNGEVETEYPQPAERTRPFLEETYGIMVYQEQVMQVAQACAGYSLGGADLLRRAMGKKIKEEMDKQREIFINGDKEAKPPVPGAVALGMDPKVASALFDDIAKFAGYGFNKSHAAAYAWIAYQTMWLKWHYPVEFFSALMSYNTDDPEKLSLIKDELDELCIPLLPPDINNSYADFRPEPTDKGRDGHAVRFGLTGIKGISGDQAELVAERDRGGRFTSVEDFYRRCPVYKKDQMTRLAEAGAFDRIADARRQAAEVLAWLSARKEKGPSNQGDLFGSAAAITVPDKVVNVPEWGDIADREFKAVGFYFSRHPIDPYVARLAVAGVRRRASFISYMKDPRQFYPDCEESVIPSLTNRRLCAMVDEVRVKVTKTGKSYIEATVSERGDAYRINCYDDRYNKVSIDDHRRVLEGAKASRKPVVFVCSMSLDNTGEGVWINAREVWDVDDFLKDIRGDIIIKLAPEDIRPSPDEAKRYQAVEAALAESRMGAEEAAAEHLRIRNDAVRRRIDDIYEMLSKKAQSDDQKAVEVRVATPDGGVKLPGRFLWSVVLENILKTKDGVVSIKENPATMPSPRDAHVPSNSERRRA
jgi:DNA polymerase-3 subunit alpha